MVLFLYVLMMLNLNKKTKTKTNLIEIYRYFSAESFLLEC